MVKRAALSIGLAVVGLLGSPEVWADTFLVPEGSGPVLTVSQQVLLTRRGSELLTIDELVVRSQAPRSVWLRTFPAEPRMGEAPSDFFDKLAQQATVEEPFNQAIRRNLFGPSIVTVLNQKLGDRPQLVAPPEERPTRRRLVVSDVHFFKGMVLTSTLTREMQLPAELEEWLGARGIKTTEAQKEAFAAHLNRGWAVMAAVITDEAPGAETEGVIGPIRFDFPSKGAIYPLVRGPSGGITSYDFYTLAEGPLAMNLRETVWNTRPWEVSPGPPAQLEATYSDELDPNSPTATTLVEFGVELSEQRHLVRTHFLPPSGSGGEDLEFHPSKERISIPSGTRRGSGLDLLLCILLGLTPLIYTPESWFLIWLVNSAKERARKDGSAFGVNLWAYFALLVAVFWVITLEGPGRIAGLVPFALGLGRLAWPYTERDTPRIRVAFKSKKKA